jgi:tetratricopeptide (TPR) repeat protein
METHIAAAIEHGLRLKTEVSLTRLMNALGLFYHGQARNAEAEPLYEGALAIDEKAYGKEHPVVATRLNNLGQLYKATGRLNEAEPLMERALGINEKAYGKEHPEVAGDLNNLARLYQDTNRLKEAEPLMERALGIDEKAYGKEHPEVACDLNNLAQLYQATSRLKEAELLSRRHLEIFVLFTRRTGRAHPHLKDAINNYGGLLMDMGCGREEAITRLKEIFPEGFEGKSVVRGA